MIDVALKEWTIVGDLLTEGRCCLLLRKGGIHEEQGPGRFALEHQRFALFPAWEHERLDWIRPAFLPNDSAAYEGPEPQEIVFRGYGEVGPGQIWVVPSREAFDQLEDLHPWAAPQVDMRFNYKPDRPLYLLAVRAYRLSEPKVMPNRSHFAGCRSWVPLSEVDQVDPSGARPALEDGAFQAICQRIARTFQAG